MQRLSPHGVKLPPEKIALPNPLPNEKDLKDDLSKLSVEGAQVYGQLNEKLIQLQNECSASTVLTNTIKELVADEDADCSHFRQGIHTIKESLDDQGQISSKGYQGMKNCFSNTDLRHIVVKQKM